MINTQAVSTRELEEESAELLPSRETLQVTNWFPGCHGRGFHRGVHHGVPRGVHHGRCPRW